MNIAQGLLPFQLVEDTSQILITSFGILGTLCPGLSYYPCHHHPPPSNSSTALAMLDVVTPTFRAISAHR